MNKVILGLIVAVCILGMALVMLNERLGRKTETPQASSSRTMAPNNPPAPATEASPPSYAPRIPAGETPDSAAQEPQTAEKALVMEKEEAIAALAPPAEREATPQPALRVDEPAADARPAMRRPEVAEAKPAPRPAEPKSEPAPRKPEASTPAQEKPAHEKGAKQDKGGDRAIRRFVIYARENGATVRIGGGDRIHYTSMTLDNPDRIVLDMDGQWQFPANPGVPKNDMVSNIRIGRNGDKTRVVIDLKGKPRSVRVLPAKNGDSLDIRVDK